MRELGTGAILKLCSIFLCWRGICKLILLLGKIYDMFMRRFLNYMANVLIPKIALNW